MQKKIFITAFKLIMVGFFFLMPCIPVHAETPEYKILDANASIQINVVGSSEVQEPSASTYICVSFPVWGGPVGYFIYWLIKRKNKIDSYTYIRDTSEEDELERRSKRSTTNKVKYYEICPGCGVKRPADAIVCPYCGHNLIKDDDGIYVESKEFQEQITEEQEAMDSAEEDHLDEN